MLLAGGMNIQQAPLADAIAHVARHLSDQAGLVRMTAAAKVGHGLDSRLWCGMLRDTFDRDKRRSSGICFMSMR